MQIDATSVGEPKQIQTHGTEIEFGGFDGATLAKKMSIVPKVNKRKTTLQYVEECEGNGLVKSPSISELDRQTVYEAGFLLFFRNLRMFASVVKTCGVRRQ